MNGQPRRAYSYWAYSGLALSSKPPSQTLIVRTGLETRLEDWFHQFERGNASLGTFSNEYGDGNRTKKKILGLD